MKLLIRRLERITDELADVLENDIADEEYLAVLQTNLESLLELMEEYDYCDRN